MSVIFEEFRCPNCDSADFDKTKDTRFCNGSTFSDSVEALLKCLFSWEKEDDWRYIRLVIKPSYKGDKGPEVAKEAAIDYFMER